jgi:hypothetical protein
MKITILALIILVCSVCIGQIKYDYFPRKALEQDLSFFSGKLTAIHPLFSDKSYSDKWNKEFSSVTLMLKDSMTQNEFYLLVSPLLSYLNDAHSNFLCPMDQRKRFMLSGGLSFPFSVTLCGNSVFISEYYGEDSLLFKGGEEIVQINALSSSVLLNKMRKLVGGNSVSIQNKTIEMNFRTYLWMISGYENDYELTLRNESNQQLKTFVKGITNDQFIRNRKRYPSVPQEQLSLFTDRQGQTAVLTLRSFADLNGFCAFADSAFRVIAENNITSLIIDIRGNSGGRSIGVDSLMNFLTGKTYSQYREIDTRISQDLKAYYKEKYPEKFEEIKDLAVDERLVCSGDTVNPHPKKFQYKGRLFLLTNQQTFSAAATFAGAFRKLNLGIIIGEETGGTIGYYGDFWYNTMPNSKLEFYISPKRFVQYGGTDMNRGVFPDYSVPDKNDGISDFTSELIKKQGNAGMR